MEPYIIKNNIIRFSGEYNDILSEKILEILKRIDSIYFGISFNQTLNNLPPNITFLFFALDFNQPIDNLPKEINKICFSPISKFNQSVNNLPINLKTILFGQYFNKTIDVLPYGITNIYFSPTSYFNQPIDNLPMTVEDIRLGMYFDQPVNNLPINLKKFEVKGNFSNSLDNLPDSIEFLKIGVVELENSKVVIRAPRATEINFKHPLNKLPASLKILFIHPAYIFLPDLIEKFGQTIQILSTEDEMDEYNDQLQNDDEILLDKIPIPLPFHNFYKSKKLNKI